MAKRLLLRNGLVNGALTDVLCEDGKIAKITEGGLCEADGAQILELDGAKLYPGLIDIHSHGAVGSDTTKESVERLADWYLENGTSTWYPTTMTEPFESVEDVCALGTDFGHGANVPGYHLEGPFVSVKYKGAQNPDYIKMPTTELLNRCKNARIITVAPELEGAIEFIKQASEKYGVVVALGHTDAGYDKGVEAFEAGARSITHTFNAMKGIHHRDPAIIGAGADMGAYAQLIADGVHVHPSAVRLIYKLYGADKITLISDSVAPTGMADGEYTLGGLRTIVKDGVARLPEGNLAGSTTPLVKCVKSAVAMGIPEADAFKMASTTPAELMGLNKGKIEVGYDADFCIVDSELNLIKAIARGEL